MKKIPIEKIIAKCNKSMKLISPGCLIYREQEATKDYLEELISLRAKYALALNAIPHYCCTCQKCKTEDEMEEKCGEDWGLECCDEWEWNEGRKENGLQ